MFPNKEHFMLNKRNSKQHSYSNKKSLGAFSVTFIQTDWMGNLELYLRLSLLPQKYNLFHTVKHYRTIFTWAGWEKKIHRYMAFTVQMSRFKTI